MIELKVPTLGESVTEATVGTWFKKAGDKVAAVSYTHLTLPTSDLV